MVRVERTFLFHTVSYTIPVAFLVFAVFIHTYFLEFAPLSESIHRAYLVPFADHLFIFRKSISEFFAAMILSRRLHGAGPMVEQVAPGEELLQQ